MIFNSQNKEKLWGKKSVFQARKTIIERKEKIRGLKQKAVSNDWIQLESNSEFQSLPDTWQKLLPTRHLKCEAPKQKVNKIKKTKGSSHLVKASLQNLNIKQKKDLKPLDLDVYGVSKPPVKKNRSGFSPKKLINRSTNKPLGHTILSSPSKPNSVKAFGTVSQQENQLTTNIIPAKPKRYLATGRRKCSVAQVSLKRGNGTIRINNQPALDYLQTSQFLLKKVLAPLIFLDLRGEVTVSIIVKGGGLVGQADAIRLGICRALCKYDKDYRQFLKQKGYLTRDARVKERKKYGLRKARKAPQYSKR